MIYRIAASNRFSKDFQKLDRTLQSRVSREIENLADNPYYGKALKGELEKRYSLRIGEYRVIYLIDNRDKVIQLITVRQRGKAYRR